MRALIPYGACALCWLAALLHAACSGWNLGVCVGPNGQRWNASVCVSHDVSAVQPPTWHQPDAGNIGFGP